MKVCPKCGTPMEYEEVGQGVIKYTCPVCGYTIEEKTKEKPKVEGIKFVAEKRGEGVVVEKRRKISISEEEYESALEILADSEY